MTLERAQFDRGEVTAHRDGEITWANVGRNGFIPSDVIGMPVLIKSNVGADSVNDTGALVARLQQVNRAIVSRSVLLTPRAFRVDLHADPIANLRLPRFPIVVAHGAHFTSAEVVA